MGMKLMGYTALTVVASMMGKEVVAQNQSKVNRSGTDISANKSIDQPYYSRLHVPAKEIKVALVDSVYVDTLILEDESTLRFSRSSVMIVEHAFVGEKCLITSAGVHGRKPGDSGEPGDNLSLVMVFHEIGSLTIDTRGGDGQKGQPGLPGANGESYQERGKQGENGGDGGEGGALRLFYSTVGFQPSINGEGKRSIKLRYTGGRSGIGGDGGMGGRPIRTDRTGKSYVCGTCPAAAGGPRGNPGIPGADGVLQLERIPD